MEILIGVFVDCFGVEVGLINCAFTANCEAGFDFKKRVGAIIYEVDSSRYLVQKEDCRAPRLHK